MQGRLSSLVNGHIQAFPWDNWKDEFSLAVIPMGRMAERDDYHAAIQFLCSDASRYMNGQNIVIDGGRSVW